MMDDTDTKGTTKLRASAAEFTLPSPPRSSTDTTGRASQAPRDKQAKHNLSVTANAFVPNPQSADLTKLPNERFQEPQLNPGAKLFSPQTTHRKPASCFVPISQAYHRPIRTVEPAKEATAERPPCRFFRQGACRRGIECAFSHDIANFESSTLSAGGSDAERIPGSELGGKAKTDTISSRTEHYTVDDGIRCKFGPGVLVQDLQLGSDDEVSAKASTKVIIRGLVSSISDYDLEARL